jgi:hypothetical protein
MTQIPPHDDPAPQSDKWAPYGLGGQAPPSLDALTDRQRALYWLTLAEAGAFVHDRLMLVSVLARSIHATPTDALAVREILMGGR